MKSGRHILLNFLLNLIINSYGNTVLLLDELAFVISGSLRKNCSGLFVNDLLNSLAVLVLAGNLSGDLNGLEVILLLNCKSDELLSDSLDLLGLSFGSGNTGNIIHFSIRKQILVIVSLIHIKSINT